METSRKLGVGERLKKSRLEAQLTQKEVGALLGVGDDAISNMERGKQDLSIGQVQTLARVLRVSPIWLAFGETPAT